MMLKEGKTPFYYAAERGYLDVCQWLKENGGKEDVRDLVSTMIDRPSAKGTM